MLPLPACECHDCTQARYKMRPFAGLEDAIRNSQENVMRNSSSSFQKVSADQPPASGTNPEKEQ